MNSELPWKPSIQDYLDHTQDPHLSRRLAEDSRLSHPSVNHHHSRSGVSRPSNGTSMLLASGSQTRESLATSQDLAALSSGASSRTGYNYPTTSLGERELGYQQRLESPIEGAPVEIPAVMRLPLLECPFNVIKRCLKKFCDFDQWYEHSLEHFDFLEPPRENQCCFSYTCPAQFQGPTGRDSWRQRMIHVSGHHRNGSRLATAQPDFKLIQFMYNNELIEIVEYRDLRANYEQCRRGAEAQSYPSPPISPNEPTTADIFGPYTQTNRMRRRDQNR